MVSVGTQLANFRITDKLGEGGMGVVWRATDERLGREVAIKVLPPDLAQSPERRRRFEREASTIAALNHPGIVTIYSLEDQDGLHFIVMELIEGQSLADRIPDDGLPVLDLLQLAADIADAVASAHSNGITHRDLKPSNIMLDADGRVKVLDFGLAKLTEEVTEDDLTISSADQTAIGQILGTLAYMSPEQAEGRTVDARSDVFSLGAVLYEMATGQHPFKRATSVSTLSAILTEAPQPVSELKESLPSELVSIIARCLERAPGDRYPSAAELRDDLLTLQAAADGDGRPPRSTGLGAVLRRPQVALPVVVLLASAIGAAVWYVDRSNTQRRARQELLPEIEQLLESTPWSGGPGMWRAYTLGREAERAIPDDPVLEGLRSRYSAPVTISSDPPGARVFARPYVSDEDEWALLGETPIDGAPFVRGVLRVRIDKEGYEPVEDLYWSRLFSSSDQGYELKKTGALPEGMVWASSTAPRVHIEAAPAGIHLPGVEHLPPVDLGDYLIDRHEVTNVEFQAFVDAGGYDNPDFWREPFIAEDGLELTFADAVARFTDSTGRPGPATWQVGDYIPGTGDHPVTGVSWHEAAAYAVFADKSLPTIYHFDRTALTWASGDIVPLANLSGDELLPVGATRTMHRFGTYDLAGNAREWCANLDSRGDRLILGGGWNDPPYAFNDVFGQSPWDRSPTNGFRCIRYASAAADRDRLEHTIELPFRDFLNEPQVSEETFALFLSQFRYDHAPLRAEIEERRIEEDYIREKISFDAAYGGERMSAYLFLPVDGKPPYQTVVVFPGSGAIHTRSSDDLTPRALFMLKSGRAFLHPVYKSTFERGDGLSSDYPDQTAFWKDHIIMWGKDLKRSVDLVEERDDLESERIAYLGFSWGAAMAPIMIAIEARIRAGIVVVAGLNFQTSLPEVDQVHYVPRVRVPMLMLNGKYDFFFPYETSQVPYYELLGTPEEHKKLVVHPTGHAVPQTDIARESLVWLDRYLGPVD